MIMSPELFAPSTHPPEPVKVRLFIVNVGISWIVLAALVRAGITMSSLFAGTPLGVQLVPVAQEPPARLFQVFVAP